MINWPKFTSGPSAMSAWLNRFLASARQCTPISIEGYRIEQGTDGFRARRNFLTAGQGTNTVTSSSHKLMAIGQLGSSLVPPVHDLLICREWDILANSFKAGATDVYVAKDIESRRNIVQEFYKDNGDNLKQTYQYFTPTTVDETYGDNFRLANDGTNTELQVMEKRYYTRNMMVAGNVEVYQALVYVVDTGTPTGIRTPTGGEVTLLEVKPIRAWIRYATQ